MKKKPYRSLDQVYLSETFAKPVPLPPRAQITIFREQGSPLADVLVQRNPPEGNIHPFKVSDSLAQRVINILNKEKKFKSASGETSPNEIIKQAVVDIDHWPEQIHSKVTAIFDKYNLNPETFENLKKIQIEKDNPTSELIRAGDGKEFKPYINLIPDSFKQLFENPDDAFKVVRDLFNIKDNISGINIGKGEVSTSLISNATKEKTGDLTFPDLGEVEIKDYGARMIGTGGGYAVTGTARELSDLLGETSSASLPERALQAARKEILTFVEKELSQSERSKSYTNTPAVREFLANIKYSLDDDRSLEELINTIETAIPQITKADKVVKTVETLKKKIVANLKNYIAAKKTAPITNFLSAVNAFFSNLENLSDDQIARGIIACRNYDVDRSSLDQIIQYILNNMNYFKTNLIQNPNFIRFIIGALHIALYKHVQNFRGILFVTGKKMPKNATDEIKEDISHKKIIYYSVPGNSLAEKFSNTINFLQDNNAEIRINIDQRGNAAQVSFKS